MFKSIQKQIFCLLSGYALVLIMLIKLSDHRIFSYLVL